MSGRREEKEARVSPLLRDRERGGRVFTNAPHPTPFLPQDEKLARSNAKLQEQLRDIQGRLMDAEEALRDADAAHTAEAAMCKWLGPKTAVDVIHQCLLTHGHYGWSLDLPHQQRLRDVMGLEIGDGTAQIMKMIVARERAGRLSVQHLNRS